MDLITISLLAIIQGITEFLPISSSGHLALAPKLFGFTDPGLAVDAFLHLGTLFAALIYFRKDILEMILGLVSFGKKDAAASNTTSPYRKLALEIIVATIPVMLIGFLFKDFFSESALLRSTKFIAFTLAFGGILMLVAENYSRKLTEHKNIFQSNFLSMFFIGLMQTLALFPGMSRSGSTITGALFTGIQKADSARLAFLVGLPAITAAGLLAMKDLMEAGVDLDSLNILGVGFILSFVSGYFAIDFMIKFLKTKSLIGFVVYRLMLAAILLFI